MTTPITKERLDYFKRRAWRGEAFDDWQVDEMINEIDRLTAELSAANKRVAELAKEREELMQYLPGD